MICDKCGYKQSTKGFEIVKESRRRQGRTTKTVEDFILILILKHLFLILKFYLKDFSIMAPSCIEEREH